MKYLFFFLFAITWRYIGFQVLNIDESWIYTYGWIGGSIGALIVLSDY